MRHKRKQSLMPPDLSASWQYRPHEKLEDRAVDSNITINQLAAHRVHFIGMGGAGMSGIARIMLSHGVKVTGSDVKDSGTLASLVALGATAFIGHRSENVEGAEIVVASSAISEMNPELIEARRMGAKVLGRAEALSILMSDSRSVAVAGTHGKTTTTSMLTVALQRAGKDPSFAIGGMINSSGTNAHAGTGDIFVAEADESDGSFLVYRPLGAIITNIELDHVDHFPNIESVVVLFHEFVASIRPGGFLVLCTDSPEAAELALSIVRTDIQVITYGASGDYSLSHISLSPGSSSARVSSTGRIIGELQLSIPGEHNLYNATAALATGIALGAPAGELLEGLTSFSGARRRFEIKGEVHGITVIDDYGHHPTEIRVTLETARRMAGSGKVWVVFQPHRYSRTQAFAHEFAAALELADQIYVLEVYAASEKPIIGVTSEMITREMRTGRGVYEPSMITVSERIVTGATAGDVILTLGAGDVNSLAPVILDSLADKYRA
jgi:UDP-N-acetylmuramate--alanine ligase